MIKNYKEFNESISGTELVGRHMGPNYPEQQVDNTTLGQSQTNVIYSEITSKIYTYDDYQDLYQDYLKIGGTPLFGFNQETLTTVLTFEKSNESVSTSIEDEIKNVVKECFLDYTIDYGMDIRFEDGLFFEEYNFISEREMRGIYSHPLMDDSFKDLPSKKAIKVEMINGGGERRTRLEIYMDEDSQKMFDESIHNMLSELHPITNVKIDGLKELSPKFYAINFIIIYD